MAYGETDSASSVVIYVSFFLQLVIIGIIVYIFVRMYMFSKNVDELKGIIGRLVLEMNAFIAMKSTVDRQQNQLIANNTSSSSYTTSS